MRRICILLCAASLAFAADGPAFEAASVKVVDKDMRSTGISGGPGTSNPGRWRAPGIWVETLITMAFNIKIDQLVGPSWLRDFQSAPRFTVEATMPPDTTKEQFRQMLQNLLAERFHLVYHRETRDFPAYALVVDKGGPKFKEVTPTVNPVPDSAVLDFVVSAGPGEDGFPKLPPGPRTFSKGSRSGSERTKYQERTMAEFVSNLGFLIGSSQGKSALSGAPQPRVVDRTGLTGRYTFILEYFDAGMVELSRMLPPTDEGISGTNAPTAGDPEGAGPDIFKAVQKLGLRLDKIAGVPTEVIVIERVHKEPTEN